MQPNKKFLDLDKSFWASVRSVSQTAGYSIRGEGTIKVPSVQEIKEAFADLHLDPKKIEGNGNISDLAKTLMSYFKHRADVLNNFVEPRLMDAVLLKNKEGKTLNARGAKTCKARKTYESLRKKLKPNCPLPMNKQRGKKKAKAFFTCMINMLIEANAEGLPCDYDPMKLATITQSGIPLRTLARRLDGAFPNIVNPHAVWEIKEYYYTTTFGSRVADGVYETLLDGMELQELYQNEGVKVLHYLMVDSHYTWWVSGRSYLCRIIDMLHMGYVDEVLFGYEVVERLPNLVKQWVKIEKGNKKRVRGDSGTS